MEGHLLSTVKQPGKAHWSNGRHSFDVDSLTNECLQLRDKEGSRLELRWHRNTGLEVTSDFLQLSSHGIIAATLPLLICDFLKRDENNLLQLLQLLSNLKVLSSIFTPKHLFHSHFFLRALDSFIFVLKVPLVVFYIFALLHADYFDFF